MTTPTIAHPPETLEGWYALHQIFRFPKSKPDAKRLAQLVKNARASLGSSTTANAKSQKKTSGRAGWTCFVRLIGSTADLMVIHFRDSLDAIGDAEEALSKSELGKAVAPVYSFLSVTEAGLYHITAELA